MNKKLAGGFFHFLQKNQKNKMEQEKL